MTTAAELIEVLIEGKTAMFDILKKDEKFTFVNKKEVYQKIGANRAKSVESGKGIDMKSDEFVWRVKS